jgi:hypothetical protein
VPGTAAALRLAEALLSPPAAHANPAKFPAQNSVPAARQLVATKTLILDFSAYDLDKVLADAEEIRRYNPQRHEMEQLTAVVYDDPEAGICVGYKDVTPHEF